MLVWDPADPGAGPVELGRHDGGVTAVAVLPDGRVVTGGGDRVLVWDPTRPGVGPVEFGRHAGGVGAVAVLPDGRVATGGGDRVLVWDPTRPGVGPVEFGRHEGGVGAVAALADGRVVTSDYDGRVLVWDPAGPGPARSSSAATTPRCGRWRCCRTGEWSPPAASAIGGCWCGTRQTPGPARSSSAATTPRCGRWRCCRTGGWSPPAASAIGGCWCGTRQTPGAGPVELGRHAGGVTAVAALPDGRVVTGSGDDRRVLVWDPADPGAGPVNLGRHAGGVTAVAALPDGRVATGGGGRVLVWDPTRPPRPRLPRWLGVGGGGAAGRAGGHRRRRLGAGVGPAGPGARPVELGRHAGVRAVAALPDGRVATGNGDDRRVLVWDQAGPRPAGCWCGTRQTPGPTRSSSAATTAGCTRWRHCRTGGWPPAATTIGCDSGMCKAAHPAACSHALRTCSLPPSPPRELASSSVTHGAEFHAGKYVQRYRTRLEPRVSRKVFRAGHEVFLRPRIAMSSAGSCFILRMVAAIFV